MMQNSISLTNEEKARNDSQMHEMKNLYGVILESARRLSSFADNLFSKTQNFSKNLNDQAQIKNEIEVRIEDLKKGSLRSRTIQENRRMP